MITKQNKYLITIGGTTFTVAIEKEGDKYYSFELKIANDSKKALGLSENRSEIDSITFHANNHQEKLLVVDSVSSGTGRNAKNDFCDIVVEPILRTLQLDYQIFKTKTSQSIASFAGELSPNTNCTIIFLSGDTTISEFLNSLKLGRHNKIGRRRCSILPLPMGTGNAFASSLGLTCPVEALGMYLAGKLEVKKFPLYRAIFSNNFSIVFFIILSLGYHANLLHLCENKDFKHMGAKRFAAAGEVVLEDYDLALDIGFTGCSRNSYAYFAVVSTPNLTKSYKLSPESHCLISELHTLGFSSNLKKSELKYLIKKGYTNSSGDKIRGAGVIYKPFQREFEICLYNDENLSPETVFEVCCDGHLFNLLDFKTDKNNRKSSIKIEFLENYSAFDLQAYVRDTSK